VGAQGELPGCVFETLFRSIRRLGRQPRPANGRKQVRTVRCWRRRSRRRRRLQDPYSGRMCISPRYSIRYTQQACTVERVAASVSVWRCSRVWPALRGPRCGPAPITGACPPIALIVHNLVYVCAGCKLTDATPPRCCLVLAVAAGRQRHALFLARSPSWTDKRVQIRRIVRTSSGSGTVYHDESHSQAHG
jgi:hypothetical protein